MKLCILGTMALMLASCGQNDSEAAAEQADYDAMATYANDAASEAAAEALKMAEAPIANANAGPPPGYTLDTPPPAPTYRPTFAGYPCTQDCSGHEAGYAWAEDNDIKDPADCGGSSQSFVEGCEAYAEDAAPAYGSDY